MERFISFIFNPNSFKAFAYSWIPALLMLWFLIARKGKSKLLSPLTGFVLGAALSSIAGYFNHISSSRFFSPESPQFFFSVGLTEESIKFIASYLGLLIIARQNWKKELRINWLVQCMSGALGFAAAENFIYGVDGQGSIARIIPLIAHTGFAIFWGIGFYKASLCKKFPVAIGWTLLGLFEGIVFHGIYDCVVSEDILTAPLKIAAWIVLGFVIALLINWHKNIISKYILENQIAETKLNIIQAAVETSVTTSTINEEIQEGIVDSQKDLDSTHSVLKLSQSVRLEDDTNPKYIQHSLLQDNLLLEKPQKIGWGWKIASILLPGFGHMVKRKENVTGLSFFVLAWLLPYVVICLQFSELSGKLISSAKSQGEILLKELMVAIAIFMVLYLLIGIWSAWELVQANKDLNKEDQKRRLSALFPISTLFFVSLFSSFFLPAIEKNRGKSDAESKNFIIKEIPLGITMEIEKEIIPQKDKNVQVAKEENSTDPNSLSISTQPFIPEKKKDEEKVKKNEIELGKGVANSQNTDLSNMPIRLPRIGYIGVQLAQKIAASQQIVTYIGFVYPGTSADRAGLKSNDVILSVNGKPSLGYDALTVSNLVRGPLGSQVEIMVYRDGIGEVKIQASRTGALSEATQNPNNLLNPIVEQSNQQGGKKNNFPTESRKDSIGRDL